MTTKKILLITLFATLFRLYLFLEFDPNYTYGDSYTYRNIAQNLVQKQQYVFTTTSESINWAAEIYGAKPPLYSFFIALFYYIFGTSDMPVIISQIIISAITGLLIYKVAFHLSKSQNIGITALFIYSFFWETALLSTQILSETLYWFLLALFTYLVIKLHDSSKNRLAAATGLALGLLTLVRPPSLTFIIPIAIWLLWKNFTIKQLLQLSIIASISLATIAPWQIRNFLLYSDNVFIYTDGGINVWMGNHSGSAGIYRPANSKDPLQTPTLIAPGPEKEIERDKFYYQKASQFIFQNPAEAIDLSIKKFILTFSPNRKIIQNTGSLHRKWALAWPNSQGVKTFMENLITYQFTFLSIFFFISFFFLYKLKYLNPNNPSFLLILLILLHLLTITTTHYEERYTMQLYPLVIPLASLALYFLFPKSKKV